MSKLIQRWNNWGYRFYRLEYQRVFNATVIGLIILYLLYIGSMFITDDSGDVWRSGIAIVFSGLFGALIGCMGTVRYLDQHEKKIALRISGLLQDMGKKGG